MFTFAQYYASLLRGGHRSEPSADEAKQDFRDMLDRVLIAGVI